MRLLIQRVTEAAVTIDNNLKSAIGKGLLVFVGIESDDDKSDIEWLTRKLLNLRIFNDENEVMNLSVKDIDGEILVISQFTLHASTKKGNRPSYIKAAKPEVSIPLYERFVQHIETEFGKTIGTGAFGVDMKVSLLNDGPVTIWIDSKQKE